MNSLRPAVMHWFWVGCAALASLTGAWFMRLNRQPRAVPIANKNQKSSGKSTLKRANAIITIRNGITQQAESTDHVATRRLFKKRPTARILAPGVEPSVGTMSTAPIQIVPVIKKNLVQAPVPAAPLSVAPATVIKEVPTAVARPATNDYARREVAPNRTIIGAPRSILLAPEFDDSLPENPDVRISCR